MSPSASYQRIRVSENIALAPHTFVLRFEGCEFLSGAKPGQFVMLRGDQWGADPLLPRAFSLLDVGPTHVDILIKTCGKASDRLEHVLPGESFSVLGPLGNTFLKPSTERQDWLIAGGVGLAPLYMHAKHAASLGLGRQCTMFYGGQSAKDLVMLDEIKTFGCDIALATVDGSKGKQGYVTHAVEEAFANHQGPPPTLMACGPEPMLEAVAMLAHRLKLETYLSLEGEMACGVGACLVCAVQCASKAFRYTCIEGPIFDLADLRGPYANKGPL